MSSALSIRPCNLPIKKQPYCCYPSRCYYAECTFTLPSMSRARAHTNAQCVHSFCWLLTMCDWLTATRRKHGCDVKNMYVPCCASQTLTPTMRSVLLCINISKRCSENRCSCHFYYKFCKTVKLHYTFLHYILILIYVSIKYWYNPSPSWERVNP